MHIAGSGDADLGQVKANVTTVHIAGSGNTDIAPSDEADIHIAGSGDVNLHSNPKRLETHIAGRDASTISAQAAEPQPGDIQMHKLAFIAVAGLGAAAVCIGAAAAIGGKNFGDGLEGLSWFDSRPHCDAVAGATANSRDMAWDGSDKFGLAINSHASYRPGTGDMLHVTGDPQVLAHLRVRDGTLELNCRGWRNRAHDLTITLPGREFHRFAIYGGGDITLDALDQADTKIEIDGAGDIKANGRMGDLKTTINGSGRIDFDQVEAREAKAAIHGSGTIRAKGKIDDLHIEIAGSGRADFGQVESRNARVEIGGHGDVDIAPTDEAKIDIGGSGDVTLHSNPKSLETHIGGSGRIHRLGSAT